MQTGIDKLLHSEITIYLGGVEKQQNHKLPLFLLWVPHAQRGSSISKAGVRTVVQREENLKLHKRGSLNFQGKFWGHPWEKHCRSS